MAVRSLRAAVVAELHCMTRTYGVSVARSDILITLLVGAAVLGSVVRARPSGAERACRLRLRLDSFSNCLPASFSYCGVARKWRKHVDPETGMPAISPPLTGKRHHHDHHDRNCSPVNQRHPSASVDASDNTNGLTESGTGCRRIAGRPLQAPIGQQKPDLVVGCLSYFLGEPMPSAGHGHHAQLPWIGSRPVHLRASARTSVSRSSDGKRLLGPHPRIGTGAWPPPEYESQSMFRLLAPRWP